MKNLTRCSFCGSCQVLFWWIGTCCPPLLLHRPSHRHMKVDGSVSLQQNKNSEGSTAESETEVQKTRFCLDLQSSERWSGPNRTVRVSGWFHWGVLVLLFLLAEQAEAFLLVFLAGTGLGTDRHDGGHGLSAHRGRRARVAALCVGVVSSSQDGLDPGAHLFLRGKEQHGSEAQILIWVYKNPSTELDRCCF